MRGKINKALKTVRNKVDAEKRNWFFIIFLEPNIYLFGLLRKTIIMGIVLTLIYELVSFLDIHEQPIPTSWHSSAGIVIGLLLVFRTNTAYDRWWEARKLFGNLESILIYLKITLEEPHKEIVKNKLSSINKNIFDFVSNDNTLSSIGIRKKIILEIGDLKKLINSKEYTEGNVYPISNLDKKINEIIDVFTSLERIKETPIPASYSLHIKTSLFLYILSLPFGLFYGLGWTSIPMAMVLFFIIAGIEIISNEIENPFRGDPNDLPIKKFEDKNEYFLKNG